MRFTRRRRRCSTAGDETHRPFVEALEPRLMLSAVYVDAVDHNGAAPNDGTSWYSAYTDLQAALMAAGGGTDIFVADGTYKPTAGTDRTISFVLRNGVGLYGGYAGYGAPDPGTRDIAAYPTILSGNIGDVGTNADNSYHVIVGSSTDATAVLDGFTITAGMASGTPRMDSDIPPWNVGGGMYNDHGRPIIRYCTFSGNSATGTYGGAGGGMFNDSSSPSLTNCTFRSDSADTGGGICNRSSSPSLANCTFSGNTATDTTSYGGGGMFNALYSSPILTNCTFSGNSAKYGGGMNNFYSSPSLINCTFIGNTATDSGGGMYSWEYSFASLASCILWANVAPSGPQLRFDGSGTATVRYSDIQGGRTGTGTGTGNINADPLFVDADGPDNIYGTPDDDLRLRAGSPCIDAGDNSAVPADTLDLDGDGNTTEPVPFDLARLPRFVDAPWVADTGKGTAPIVDMGAYERRLRVPGDADGSGLVDQDDYKIWYDNYGTGTTWEQGNFKGYGVTDQDDYKTWYDNYGVGTAGGSAAVTSQPTAGLDAATPSPMLAGISQIPTMSQLSATTTSSPTNAEVAGNTTQTNAKIPALPSVTAPTCVQHNRKLAARRAVRLAATTAGCQASASWLFAEACVVHLDGL